jgi:predicted dehydrogenase/threonine dehydrogenase-like Zn-dependent dehydrogenase
MKQILQHQASGDLIAMEVPVPTCLEGGVLVHNAASVISAGTERTTVSVARKSLIGKARARPDLVRQVLASVKDQGLGPTIDKVRSRLDALRPLGYSCAGTVIETGRTIEGIRPGDRVACAGGGYANHAETVFVPRNLCVRVPENVTLDSASFTTLGSIALHGVRQADARLGEWVAVLGLGLIGQIIVQVLKTCGCRVVAVDPKSERVALAEEGGADACVCGGDVEAAVRSSTGGQGVDSVILAASTRTSDLLNQCPSILRDRGRVVVLGAVGMAVEREPFYRKEIDIRFSRSYGPGRYDPVYEEGGVDYPVGYVRWTEQRNMSAFLELVASGHVDVQRLVTHRFPVDDASLAYDLVSGKTGESHLGVLLEYKPDHTAATRLVLKSEAQPGTPHGKPLSIGFVGAGNFAQANLLPHLRKRRDVGLSCVATGSGGSARKTGSKFGFSACSTEAQDVLADPETAAVFIVTRHNSHASLVVRAMEAGKAVFVEKPLALSECELDGIIKAREEHGGRIQVGFNRRFAPLIGATRSVFAGSRDALSIAYRINAGPIPRDHWIQDAEVGGGRVVGEVCHFIDLIQYLTGAAPVRVFAQSVIDGDPVNLDRDTLNVIVTFSNGCIGSVCYIANGDRGLSKERIEIFGGGHTVVIEDFRRGWAYENGKRRRIRAAGGKGYRQEVEAFLGAVRSVGPMPIPFEELVATTRATLAIEESLRTGQPVDVAPVTIEPRSD